MKQDKTTQEENEALRLQQVISSLMSKLDQKKEKLLIYIVKKVLNKPIDEKTGSRIFCLRFEGKPHYERYVWDYGKMSEKFLMEWDLVFPELDLRKPEVNLMPTIEVNAPVSVEGCL